MKWLLGLVTLVLLSVGCFRPNPAPPSPYPRRPIPNSENKKGVHLLLADTYADWPLSEWREHMTYAREATGEWGYVVQLVRLDDLDRVRWQHFMALCAELHLTPIIRLATTSNATIDGWDAPPQNRDGGYRTVARQYATFLAELTWPTDRHFVMVGNEPNHGNEWGGMPNPSEYAHFLIDVADAVHAADPDAIVLNAGLDTFSPHSNGRQIGDSPPMIDAESFMDGMVAAQPHVFTYIDAWASHPYPLGAFVEPPENQQFQVDYLNGAINPQHVEPPDGVFNRGINGYTWELFKLETLGEVGLPVFVTETGWRFGEAGWVSAETAAQYLHDSLCKQTDAFNAWQFDARVVAVVPFAFNGDPERWGHSNWLHFNAEKQIMGTSKSFEAWRDADC